MSARFLARDTIPLSSDQWTQLDRLVVETARRSLVGRRFIPIYGPLGAGVHTVPLHEFEGVYIGEADLSGEVECGLVKAARTRHIALPIIHKDFLLLWRNVAAGTIGIPLDFAPAASAAASTARKEDDLIFNGNPELGLDGIFTVADRIVMPLGDWSQAGNAFNDVTQALERLASEGYFGPYALAVSPLLHARMHRVHERTGVLEIRNVEELVTAGVFRSPVIPANRAAVVSVGAQNLDLALAQDMVTAVLGPEKMNYLMRVFEVLALRIKRPRSIVTLEGPMP